MTTNRISAALTKTDREAVMDALTTIKTRLPFLIDLTTHELEGSRSPTWVISRYATYDRP